MFPGAYDIREFYATDTGQFTRYAIARRLQQWWPVEQYGADQVLAGFGYAQPYLDAYAGMCSAQLFTMLPHTMGAMAWQAGRGAQVALVIDRQAWPLPEGSIDRLFVIHELEYADDPHAVLSEVWRVLSPQGRMVIAVPNRAGLWARAAHTPFGQGRPYTFGQLVDVLHSCDFTLERTAGALLPPPFTGCFYNQHVCPTLERAAPALGALCGVVMIEVSKRLFAPIGSQKKQRARLGPVRAVGRTVPQG